MVAVVTWRVHCGAVCLSAEVSFSLSGALLIGGGYCVEKAVRSDHAALPLAVVPIMFGLQQFCEGWVWVGLHRGDAHLVTIAGAGFLFFAMCFWPAWIPFSMLLVERRGWVHKWLWSMTLVGIVIGLVTMVPLIVDASWLHVEVEGHSLHYNVDSSPAFRLLPNIVWQAVYFVAVASPLVIATNRKLVHFGMALILSAATTHVFVPTGFASVWCCFAAAMSLYIVTLFYRMPRGRLAGPTLTRT